MTYTAECERCGEDVDEPFLMGQFHEEQFMTTPLGDRLRNADYTLQDTLTFCGDCTFELLADGR